jgi:uncharacterized caspase-like protein
VNFAQPFASSAAKRAVVLLGFLALLFVCAAAHAEGKALKGVALIVGQSQYENLPALANPAGDAKAVERLLSDLGFEVDLVTDADLKKLQRSLDRFVEDAAGADVALLYYAGHGIEAAGENFLVPVDADLSALGDAEARLVPVTQFVKRLQATVPVTIALLDACRSDPFLPGATAVVAGQAAPVSAAGLGVPRGAVALQSVPDEGLGTVLGFAAAPGAAALDGTAGEHSPYAAALLKHLPVAGHDFGDVMTMVTEEVYVETAGQQRPWTNESLRRLLYFGLSPETADGDEAAIRGARRQLLLTIAATPPETRSFVETLAKSDAVPLDALYGMLKELKVDTSAGPDDLEKQLREGAQNLKTFMAERGQPVRNDPELVRLASLADQAQAEGAIGLAKDFRASASARADELSKTLDKRQSELAADRFEIAATYADHAETAILAFDFETAAKRYADAFTQVEKWDQKLAWTYKLGQADALQRHGENRGDNAALKSALLRYGEALAFVPRERAPLDWARTEYSLAGALETLGARESEPGRLEQAVVAYRAALKEWTRDRMPLDWARTQNDLGTTLDTLGERESDPARLQEAVAAYRAALEVRTRKLVPVDWARTQTNLGVALSTLGERNGGTALLEQSVAAYRAALEELNAEAERLQWASTQNNLGTVLQALGQRESGTARLEQAVAAYRAALEVQTRELLPMRWAEVQNNLGIALQTLGQRNGEAAQLEEAVAAFHAALEEQTRERVPLNWAHAQNNLGSALQALAGQTGEAAPLEEAVAAYRSALEELTRERSPLDWARVESNLGAALATLGKFEKGPAKLEQAVAAYRAALQARTRELVPLDWAQTQNNLGVALRSLGERESGTAWLDQAVAAFHAALEERTRERVPLDWAQTQNNLGLALKALADRESGTVRLQEAIAAFRAALEVRTRGRAPQDWARSQSSLGVALGLLASRTGNRDQILQAKQVLQSAWDFHKSAGHEYDAYFADLLAQLDRLPAAAQ